MANAYKLFKVCASCNGTGVQSKRSGGTEDNPVFIEVTCADCQGSKKLFWGWCTEAVFEEMPE